MGYLNDHGLGTFWSKIKNTFGAAFGISPSTTAVDIILKNKADTPDSIDSQTIPGATSTQAGVMTAAQAAKLAGIDDNANNYTHPTTSGNRHIPSGGSSGQILRYAADGTAEWGDETGAKLYPATGQNTDGAMTQKAVTDALGDKYEKPSGGIPKTDLAAAVQTSLEKADSALQQHQDISGKADKATTLTGYGITDAYTKSEVDSAIETASTGAAKYKGTIASEAELTALANYKQSWYWMVSAAFTSATKGITLDVGNMIFANKSAAAYAAANFDVIQADIEAIPDSVINALS